MDEVVDVVIVGAGPAGIAAAIYLQRAGLSPLLLERERPGGLLRNANLVENYPGFPHGIRGEDLAEQFAEQLRVLGIGARTEVVKSVNVAAGLFNTTTDKGRHRSRAVIVATGTSPRRTNIKGLSVLSGKKVFYNISSMPFDGKGSKRILVIGGGDAAFDYGLNLHGHGHRATIVSRSKPRCLQLLRARAAKSGIDTRIGYKAELVEDKGDRVVLTCRVGDKVTRLEADLVLVACGRVPNLAVLSPSLLRGARVGACPPRTDVPGLYVAGDVVRRHNRQTGIAVGDGILAAMLVEQHLRDGRGA